MEDLSLHILDIAENSVRAGASEVSVSVSKSGDTGLLVIEISDNGRGLMEEEVKRVFDPFFTRRTERRVGLGLPLLAQASEECGGKVVISSTPGKGTSVRASFQYGHIDMKPVGDLGGTMVALISGYPEVAFRFAYRVDGEEFSLDTAEVKERLGEVSIREPSVLSFLGRSIEEGMKEVERRP
jgi:hypothetical protein